MVKDPVCHMDVDEKKATEKYDYRGRTYYFCNRSCKIKFQNDPEKYVR